MKPVKAVVLKLNGKPLDLHPESPSVRTIKQALDRSSEEDVFSGPQLAELTNLRASTIRDRGSLPAFDGYTVRLHGERLWGNPKAIAELKRQLEVKR